MNGIALAGSFWSSASSLVLGLAVFQAETSLWAADVAMYSVKEGLVYRQKSATQPSLETTNGYPFQADVYPAVQGSVTNAYVKVAGSNYFTQLTLTTSETHYQYKRSKNKLTTLRTDFPAGNYLFAMDGVNDGTVSAKLSLQGNLFPVTPYVTNFTQLQSVNANGYCVVGWKSYGSGAAADFIRLTISDSSGNNLFQSPNLDQAGAWGGLTSYTLIKPGVLAMGQTYTATLEFQKNTAVNLTSYPGALGVAGYFTDTKLSVATSMAVAPDAKDIEVDKGVLWVQTDSGPPVPAPSGQYQFEATAKAYLPGSLTSATLLLPGTPSGVTRTLALAPDQVTLEFQDSAANATALDAAYARGNYTLNLIAANDGAKSLALALQSVTNAPPPPHVANFDSLQAVDTTQPFTVSWDSWSAGAPSDFVRFRIDDLQGNHVYESPSIGSPKALNPAATNRTVAVGTLIPGQSYVGSIYFEHLASVDTTTYPAVLLCGAYFSQTTFNIGTQGTANLPVLTLARLNASHLIQVAATVTPGQSYRLDGSPVLPPVWTPLVTNTTAGSTFLFLDPNSAARPQFFYRLALLP